jgi:serine/threonine protein kinase
MPLAPGTRIGPYEIDALLGAVGMGEVYRARDTSLNRKVAMKILPESFATDADRVARKNMQGPIDVVSNAKCDAQTPLHLLRARR